MELPTESWQLSTCVQGNQRDCLARFWLSAPQDQLASLWESAIGDVTRQLVRQLTLETKFEPAQVSFRELLGDWCNRNGLSHPLSAQFMLANFLFSPPGLLKINNPEQYFPEWMVIAYRELYELEAAAHTAPSSSPITADRVSQIPSSDNIPAPDFGVFPSTLEELISNRIQLNRMLGLSNLYYIDPEDREISAELLQMRRELADAINRCSEQDLERLWSTDLGDRYWAMVRSGVQKEELTQEDEMRKQAAAKALTPSLGGGGFGTPGALNAFLVSMLYYLPGTMKVDNAQQKLPVWLFSQYDQIFSQSQIV